MEARQRLIGDRFYDSDPLDEKFINKGIEPITPDNSSRVRPAIQDRRKLRKSNRC
jgi:hypothetical protein